MKKVIVLLIVVLALAATFFAWQYLAKPKVVINDFESCVAAGYEPDRSAYPPECQTPDGKTYAADYGNAPEKLDLIRLTAPTPSSVATSPLTISGQARGFWFFEASFPVKLLDENGQELGTGIAQAQSDWTTPDFVPFSAALNFRSPTTKKGTLVLQKDNPSGLPANDDQLRIPVKFGQ